jgi:hypothetical protein
MSIGMGNRLVPKGKKASEEKVHQFEVALYDPGMSI